MNRVDIAQALKTSVSEEMGLPLNEITDDDSFFDLGLDSISSILVMERIEKKLNIRLNPIAFWDYPTIEAFTGHLEEVVSHQRPA